MREIITIQVGQCGNQIGNQYWEDICAEHSILPTGFFTGDTFAGQFEGVPTHFSETPLRRYVPRAILMDMDPMTLDSCRCSRIGQLYHPDNFIFGRSGAENNWARGYYMGQDTVNYALEALRREAENCESFCGYQIIHGVGGGSGSGLTSLLLERLKEEYSKKITTCITVNPSRTVSDVVVENYNTVLTMPFLVHLCDFCINFDNDALFSICKKIKKLDSPLYEDTNELISNVMTGVSACMRFPNNSYWSLKQHNLLCRFPEAHFFVPSYAPLNSRGVQAYRNFSLENIMQQIFHRDTYMASVNLNKGKFLTTDTILGGRFSGLWLEQILRRFQKGNEAYFAPWLDYHSWAVCSIPAPGTKIAATHLANHTAIARIWERTRQAFWKMYQKKAYTHWYHQQGLDKDEFIEADEEFAAITERYRYLESLEGCSPELSGPYPGCYRPHCVEPISDDECESVTECDPCHGAPDLTPVCIKRALPCGCTPPCTCRGHTDKDCQAPPAGSVRKHACNCKSLNIPTNLMYLNFLKDNK